MNSLEIINNVVAGGLLGIIGQGIRVAVGLKKLSDTNTINVAQNAPQQEISTSRILTSIFIGFVAGALALIIKGAGGPDVSAGLTNESIIATIAIGYSGADFIEGFFNTHLNKTTTTATTTTAATTPATTTGTATAKETEATAANTAPDQEIADFEDETKG